MSRWKRTPRVTAVLAILGLGLGLFGSVVSWVLSGVVGWTTGDLVWGLMFGAVIWAAATLPGLILEIALFCDAKRLHVLSSTGTFVLGDRELSFDDLVVPRRVDRLEPAVQKEPDDPTECPIPFVVIAHRTEAEIALRGGQDDFKQQDALAEHINAIFAEYHLRKAARTWLALHDADRSTPYRRIES